MWHDDDDEIIGGDLTAALAYVTPAGGAVVTPVAPIGLRDARRAPSASRRRSASGASSTASRRTPTWRSPITRASTALRPSARFVLVQGTAYYDASPDSTELEERIRPASTRFLGAPATGPFWDRWLSAYYADRVVVTVQVARVCSWPNLLCSGDPGVAGAPLPGEGPASQAPPGKGTAPRVDPARVAERIGSLPHLLLAYVGADGFPVTVPASVGGITTGGVVLEGPLPAGGRRAGLLAHSYRPQLIGLESRQYTGWLQDGVYAPHTEAGFRAPANKTLLLLVNGFMARRGLKRARALGRG